MFGSLDIESIFADIKSAGFDGVDLSISDDESYSIKNYEDIDIKLLGERYGLEIPVCSALMKGPTHDLSQKDNTLREGAITYVKKCVDVTVHAGADKLLVMPSRIFHTSYYDSRDADWNRSVQSLKECGTYALERGVSLLLEPLNRQRVTMVRTMEEGVRMIRDIGLPNIALVPDIYQLAMEEPRGIPATIYRYGPWIKNLHVADSTRQVPGTGAYPWGEIVMALYDVGYQGALSYEPVFKDFDADLVAEDVEYHRAFVQELRAGVRFLDAQMKVLQTRHF